MTIFHFPVIFLILYCIAIGKGWTDETNETCKHQNIKTLFIKKLEESVRTKQKDGWTVHELKISKDQMILVREKACKDYSLEIVIQNPKFSDIEKAIKYFEKTTISVFNFDHDLPRKLADATQIALKNIMERKEAKIAIPSSAIVCLKKEEHRCLEDLEFTTREGLLKVFFLRDGDAVFKN